MFAYCVSLTNLTVLCSNLILQCYMCHQCQHKSDEAYNIVQCDTKDGIIIKRQSRLENRLANELHKSKFLEAFIPQYCFFWWHLLYFAWAISKVKV